MRSRIGLVVGGWCLSILLAATPAYAGGRGHQDHGYYGDHGYHHGYRRDRGHYRQRRHHNREGAYLLGGLVIGTVIGQALTPRPSYDYPRETSRRYPDREPVVTRRLYRDLDGNCFERNIDGRGRETLLALPPYECEW